MGGGTMQAQRVIEEVQGMQYRGLMTVVAIKGTRILPRMRQKRFSQGSNPLQGPNHDNFEPASLYSIY